MENINIYKKCSQYNLEDWDSAQKIIVEYSKIKIKFETSLNNVLTDFE